MIQLNKLVRDKVPSLVTKDGGSYSLKLLSPLEHQHEITNKLFEELSEYSTASGKVEALEELVDIVELIYAAVKLHDVSLEEFESIRSAKKKLKGGFEKGIFLNEISNNDE
ncbi:nucleoside triphosphate pyrophosphohydrolase [Solibacillus sp. FSL H8-0538]|uniref:nucleoside triphosphate pyrophosphohydrolase n=1 Tax=Solibacillus sp. FSL H8-0538 TaxID=2921400 RepID=UPI0030F5D52F